MSTKIKMTSNSNSSRYAVIRNGSRVSDVDYTSKEDAKSEYDHWNRIINRWPDGSKLEIVEVKGNKSNS
jgi:hypothetical protein